MTKLVQLSECSVTQSEYANGTDASASLAALVISRSNPNISKCSALTDQGEQHGSPDVDVVAILTRSQLCQLVDPCQFRAMHQT